jgi:lipopolysaccharide export system protein LptA
MTQRQNKKKNRFLAAFLKESGLRYAGLFSLTVFFFSGNAVGQGKDDIILKHADVFAGKNVNGEDLRELTGNVHLAQGNVLVWCDKAVQHLARNEVELMGRVRVLRDTVTLTAKRGTYYGNTKKAVCEDGVRLETSHVILMADSGTYFTEEKRSFFHSHVRVVDSTTTIFSDELTYLEKERESIAIHHVKVINADNNVRLFGDYLEHFDDTRYTRITEQPRLMQIDTSSKGVIDTLVVKSLLMESYDDSTKKLIANDSVAMSRGPLSVRCGWARYFTQKQFIELRQEPVVWYDDNQASGDSITLFMSHNKLQHAVIRNRTFALSLSDSAYPARYNQLTGRKIEMFFQEDKLHEMAVDQNAISLYYLYDGKDPNGANRTSGDVITMTFLEGKIDLIRIVRGIEGTYYPESMVLKKETKYNLDGFELRTDRPTLKTIFPTLKNL